MTATIFKTTFDIPCEIYGCNTRARYAIGNQQGPPNVYINVCPKCMESIIKSVPQELLPENEEQEKELEDYKEKIIKLEAIYEATVKEHESKVRQLETQLRAQGTAVKELTKMLEGKKGEK